MPLVLQKGLSLVLGNLFQQLPGLMLAKWCSWLVCGFPSLSIPLHPNPNVWWWRQVYPYAAAGSMELSSDRSSWYSLFSKLWVIREFQEELNPSFIFSAGIPSCCILPSFTERLPHHFIAYWVARYSLVSFLVASPVQLCPVSFLPWSYLGMYQCAGSM